MIPSKLDIDNLITDSTSQSTTEKTERKLIKRKKKAQFELPKPPTVVKSLPTVVNNLPTFASESKRLQRRISPDFVPIFDINEVTSPEIQSSTSTTERSKKSPSPRVSSLPRQARIQPRGEGYRLQYTPTSSRENFRLLTKSATFNI